MSWSAVLDSLAFHGPLRGLAQTAVLANEALRGGLVALELPIKPAHSNRRGGPAVGVKKSAAVSGVLIHHHHRDGIDLLEVIHAVGVSDVGRSTEDVEN